MALKTPLSSIRVKNADEKGGIGGILLIIISINFPSIYEPIHQIKIQIENSLAFFLIKIHLYIVT
jgi:hypothetical protein